ncbi:MAG: hypothetical protein NT051_03445, partial [Candidatus Micrarchaeota archaeon]|nr:hypothetical protein [Candidatus Micrarchaeota archaeon]
MLFSKYAKKLEGKIENAHPSQLDRLGTKLERTYKFQRFFSINESRDALTGKLYGLLMKQGFEASTLLNGQQDALEQYTKAITLAPERFEAYLKRGEILHELKK